MFPLDQDKIDWSNEIGCGSYGRVYPYKEDPPGNDHFVVKVAHVSDFSDLLGYIQEIVLGFNCEHTNVLPVRGYHIDYDPKKNLWSVYIKLERMNCTLKSRINGQLRESKYFSQEEIIKYLYEMSCGLEYLHKRGIAHRDIKPENILISKSEELKLADMGVGKFVGDNPSSRMSSTAGTLCYMAPEILDPQQRPYLKKRDLFQADIWSLGVVVAEMCLLELRVVSAEKTGGQNEDNIKQKLKKLEEKIYDKDLVDLIKNLIISDPTKRKSLQNIQKFLREKYGNYLKDNYKKDPKFGIPSLTKKNLEERKTEESNPLIKKDDLEEFYEKLIGSFKISFDQAQIKPLK